MPLHYGALRCTPVLRGVRAIPPDAAVDEVLMPRSLLLGFAAAALPILSAAAAPATPDEAARLSALLERYVGRAAPGEAPRETVAPKGDGYAVMVDLKRSLAGLDAFGFAIEPYTVNMVLTPRPDGTWRVQSDDTAPLVMHAGDQTISLTARTSAFDGTFDPKLGSFSSFREDQTGAGDERGTPTFVQSRHTDAVALSGTGVPAENGTVSTASHSVGTGAGREVTFKPKPSDPSPGNPAVPPPSGAGTTLSYASATTRTDTAVDRLDAPRVLDLWAFLAAHPSRDSVTAAQDELKGLLRAGLPYLGALKQTGALDAPSLSTPIGVVSARTAGLSLEASGLGGTGKAGLSVSAADIVAPSGQLPPWSAGLVPTALDLHVGIDGFHAAEAAKAAVDVVDLRHDVIITPEQKEQVGRVFLPDGGTLTLQPSRITTKMLDLTMEGRAALGPQPGGRVTLSAKGLDAEIAALQAQAATDPGAGQALGPLVLAKNLAKPNPDGTLGWVIDFGHGPVTVNGAPLQ